MIDDGNEPEGRPLGRRAFLALVGAGLSSLAYGGSVLDLFSKSTLIVPEPLRAAIPVGQARRIYAVNPPYPAVRPRPLAAADRGPRGAAADAHLRAVALASPGRPDIGSSLRHRLVGRGAHWRGVRFADLLADAAPPSAARALTFVSAETPYVDTLTLRQALARDAMLAHSMDGRPLTARMARRRAS